MSYLEKYSDEELFKIFDANLEEEIKSRGYEDTPEKKARFQREIDLFRAKWGRVVDAGDPYYNPNFAKDKAPFTLY